MDRLKKIIVASSIGLALCSSALVFVTQDSFARTAMSDPLAPRHPVTVAMVEQAKRLNQQIAPFFKLPGFDGRTVVLGGAGGKPQFIYTIKKDCPCSFDAEPVMVRFQKHFEGEVEFAAITDQSTEEANLWAKEFSIAHNIVSDPKLEVMRAYQSPASVYCTLVDGEGKVVRRWAGYSKTYMAEMNVAIFNLLGTPEKAFDLDEVPVANTSGCEYEGYSTPTR